MNTYIRSLFILFSCVFLQAQELPPIYNFSTAQYQGDTQNWAITQDQNQIIYVANGKGLLEFNGNSWRLNPSPNQSIIRSVYAYDDKVYTGAYKEFGYWKRNKKGLLTYYSISQTIEQDIGQDEQFWTIFSFEKFILFQSLERVYVYDTETSNITITEAPGEIVKMVQVNNQVFVSVLSKGIYQLTKGNLELVSNHAVFTENRIVNMYAIDNKLLAQTALSGIYFIEDTPTLWGNTNAQLIASYDVYSSIQTRSGDIVLGTISNGVVYINKDTSIQFSISKQQNLSNNTVLSIYEDFSGNLWLGLDNGIDCINLNAPITIFNDDSGLLGTVYAAVIFEDHLYLGTNQGLFYRPIDANTNASEFTLVESSIGQVWSLFVHDNTLFCGHHNGTFKVNKQAFTPVSNHSGTWIFKTVQNNPNLLLQGHYQGISILHKSDNQWKLKNIIEDFSLSSKFIEFINEHSLLISHEYQGVFRLELNKDLTQVAEVHKDTTVSKGLYSSLFKNNDGIFYAYQDGVWRYNHEIKTFEKDTFYSNMLEPYLYESGKVVVTNDKSKSWFFTNSFINLVYTNMFSNANEVLSIPVSKIIRNTKQGYENVAELGNNTYLFGNAKGFFILDLESFQSDQTKPMLVLNNVSASKINSPLEYLSLHDTPVLNNKQNQMVFNVSIPNFDLFFTPQYQYLLKGLMDDWSPWSTQSIIELSNLPYGNYEMLIRGRVGEHNQSETINYKFKIKRPFMLSNLMLIVYFILSVLFLLLIHSLHKAYYKRQKKELEKNNKREIELREIESKNALMKLKNDNLHHQIGSKNRELAISTMSIIKKNEFLNKIKDELQQTPQPTSEIKRVIKIIDKSINSNDDWEFFENAFNNADKDFFKKIKALHPSLTPDDLRLCAYLRLNLSSKEISPLFNISPKSVEVKRYRLRKKMNLESDVNLIDYIISL